MMNIITVIPIARGIGKETLSYFTSLEVNVGALVEVPLRKKLVSALVVSREKAEERKAEIRQAPYEIKKVESIKATDLLLPQFIEAAAETAEYFASTTGSILSALVPAAILSAKVKVNLPKVTTPLSLSEVFVIQGDEEERFASYRSRIREQFARRSSVIFCTPTIEDAKRSLALLKKGIDGYTFLIHGGLSKKALSEIWEKVGREKHPILIVGTGMSLSAPRGDIGTIVIERENSRNYKMAARPHADLRRFAEVYAGKIGAKLILGDILLRTETLWREAEGELIEHNPFKFRSLTTSSQELVDMRSYKKGSQSGFKIFGEEADALIRKNKEASEHLFILTTRRGIAPTTLCGDCQSIVACESCGAPVVLHRNKSNEEKSFFLCHRCGERRGTDEVCKKCGSWNLATVGIGIDLVEEKIKDRFKGTNLLRLDADSVKSEKKIEATIAEFYATPGSILLGTEMALHYLHERVANSLIVSIDSLFSIPDFRIHEKILYNLLKIRSLTAKKFILQTRNPDEKVLEYALKGNLIDFYRSEIAMREKYNYPPFKVLIKLTLEGKREPIVREMDEIQDMLLPYEVDIFPAFTQTARGNVVLHGLIRIDREKWVDADLLKKLRSLPPHVEIKVDPESLL